jgi:hypothetical protein
VCVCVCVCVCMCVCMRMYVYKSILFLSFSLPLSHTRIYTYTYAYMYTYIYQGAYTRIEARARTRSPTLISRAATAIAPQVETASSSCAPSSSWVPSICDGRAVPNLRPLGGGVGGEGSSEARRGWKEARCVWGGGGGVGGEGGVNGGSSLGVVDLAGATLSQKFSVYKHLYTVRIRGR